MSYNPTLKLYYYNPASGTQTDDDRLVPMPLLTIEPELLYVNDIIVGYNYNVTLEGYATALDLRTYSGGDLNFTNTMSGVQKVRDVFNSNGNTLLAIDDTGPVIVASGGLLQSLDFQETDNNWFNYAKYIAQISFDSLYLGNCSGIVMLSCSGLPSGITNNNSTYLADMKKYRIKSIQEGWDIDGTNIHNNSYDIPNAYLDITYNIQAVGKNFMNNGSFIPAWQQAKNYCIDRLKQEIIRLNNLKIGPMLSSSQSGTCSTSTVATNLSSEQTVSLLHSLPSGEYKIYNETLETDVSETDGSFNLVYKSILKQISSNNILFHNKNCIHRITRSRATSDDGNKKTTTETISGEIEGLIPGGLINNFEILSVPQGSGGYLINYDSSPPSSGTKYSHAVAAYNSIINSGSTIGRELKSSVVVDMLGITNFILDPLSANPSAKPKKNSHNAVHNYGMGTISYTEEYNNENLNANSGTTITNVNVSIEDSVYQTTEFVVPGRQKGPIIQQFPAKTAKRVTISIDGTSQSGCCANIDMLDNLDMCLSGLPMPTGVPGTGISSYEITNNTFNFNIKDGSFTANREYTYIG